MKNIPVPNFPELSKTDNIIIGLLLANLESSEAVRELLVELQVDKYPSLDYGKNFTSIFLQRDMASIVEQIKSVLNKQN
jgi:hypothetical protein